MLKIVIFLSYFFLHKQCVGIPVLKIVMSHVRKSVTSGIIFNKLSSYLVIRSPGGSDMANR